MEQVFPVEINIGSAGLNLGTKAGFQQTASFKQGVVEKILEPGSFVVTLADGGKVKVQGPSGLKVGSRVQVSTSRTRVQEAAADIIRNQGGAELQGSALIPLGFGGKGAKARLEVFTEKKPSGGSKQAVRAIYFVLMIQTQELGEVQWCIHMQGRSVTLQVFAPQKDVKPDEFKTMLGEVERSLKSRGFFLTAPTIYLNRAFKVPAGYRLNVRG